MTFCSKTVLLLHVKKRKQFIFWQQISCYFDARKTIDCTLPFGKININLTLFINHKVEELGQELIKIFLQIACGPSFEVGS